MSPRSSTLAAAAAARPALPPGQTRTEKFPVTGEKAASEVLTTETWCLTITGAVRKPLSLRFQDLLELPQETLVADIHCVTSWSQLGMHFEGVRFSELMRCCRVESLPSARYVSFRAYSDRRHDTSLPLELALEDSWLVHRYGGAPLAPEHGHPVRVVTPSRYFYKSLKWLKEIVLLERDALGFWERNSGYHTVGDPWREQRLEGRRFTSRAEVEKFRDLVDFSAYRSLEGPRGVIVKANLRAWRPRTQDLRGLRLKACDFRGADLRGADLRGANLTLGQFQGADLASADLSEADLEGANFSGAFLAGARLKRNALSATIFRSPEGQGLASFQNLRVSAPEGLLESQEVYLRDLGVLKD